MYTTLNYSPNFDVKKRKSKQIKFIIFHYTGMKKEKDAIKKLISKKSKLSSHYFIKDNGEILMLVPCLYTAWHAGVSAWKNYKSLNNYSIGIEISNKGHQHNYKKFSQQQIISILKLTRFLIKKYKIKPKNILGHSDIAPDRKKDPGEKFPWRFLARKKLSYWHNLNERLLLKLRNQEINNLESNQFIQNLYKIGYVKNSNIQKDKFVKMLVFAFQRRFRQKLINGIIDKECLIISKNLIKNLK